MSRTQRSDRNSETIAMAAQWVICAFALALVLAPLVKALVIVYGWVLG